MNRETIGGVLRFIAVVFLFAAFFYQPDEVTVLRELLLFMTFGRLADWVDPCASAQWPIPPKAPRA